MDLVTNGNRLNTWLSLPFNRGCFKHEGYAAIIFRVMEPNHLIHPDKQRV